MALGAAQGIMYMCSPSKDTPPPPMSILVDIDKMKEITAFSTVLACYKQPLTGNKRPELNEGQT